MLYVRITLYRLIWALFYFLGIITRAKIKNVAMGLLDTLKLIFVFLVSKKGGTGKNFTGKNSKNFTGKTGKKIYKKFLRKKKK